MSILCADSAAFYTCSSIGIRRWNPHKNHWKSVGNPQGWVLLLTMCAAGIGGTLQYGYNLTIINAPTNHIQKFVNATWRERYGSELDSWKITLIWSIIVSVFPLGGFMGALLAGPMAIRLGRLWTYPFCAFYVCPAYQYELILSCWKLWEADLPSTPLVRKKSLLFNNIFIILSAIFCGFSRYAKSFEMIILGRILAGVNSGYIGGLSTALQNAVDKALMLVGLAYLRFWG
ncbi:unnamed protein product [Ranitomeya imitator]|uniref:Major facilitator superfamily (MFS) profile domain-containing protein n=1 Tax=Ranitomeya imitator TaxID=111125 RepID=A0ABN9L0N6_9NEOB|nr:unnamed protein product [Ranitomeya imitator]